MTRAFSHCTFVPFNFKPLTASTYNLSEPELEVLQLIADGYTDDEIAEKLYITIHTANAHRKNLLEKMKCVNAASLVANAFRKGLVK